MNEINEIARSLIPVRMEAVWGGITGVTGTMATFLFGQWNDALQALAVFMLIDYITGVMAAYMKPRAKLSSKRGLRGIVKKIALVTFVVFAHYLDLAIGQNIFMVLVTYALLGNEGLSITENLSHCGVPIPVSIRDKLEQLAHEKEGDSYGDRRS
ncbi:holin family protein [Selenomonas sp. AE3005]|uniref:phage holin family protein n=1 Tax=Selenomonas sp. AE3005 TaxID=1485543 RepID=UPI000691F67F|nr:phage holin family protein [Selenomonas sp. AE3005]